MKKPIYKIAAATLFLTGTACGSNPGQTGSGNGDGTPVEAVAPPEGGDWSKMVTQTSEGGFVMGNPNADVKLVEFGSMTCSHCADFAEKGVGPLVENYVKTGRVAFEFRNFVRDPLDITMALIARCGGEQKFFPLTEAMFANQADIFQQVQSSSAEEQQQIAQLPPAQQFAGFARLAGLQQWAAQRGIPSARQQQCLADQAAIDRLVQMTSDASSQHDVQGTPSFLINGKLAENAANWEALEPQIRTALGQ